MYKVKKVSYTFGSPGDNIVGLCGNVPENLPPKGTPITISWEVQEEIKSGQVWGKNAAKYTVVYDNQTEKFKLMNSNFVVLSTTRTKEELQTYLNSSFTLLQDVE